MKFFYFFLSQALAGSIIHKTSNCDRIINSDQLQDTQIEFEFSDLYSSDHLLNFISTEIPQYDPIKVITMDSKYSADQKVTVFDTISRMCVQEATDVKSGKNFLQVLW